MLLNYLVQKSLLLQMELIAFGLYLQAQSTGQVTDLPNIEENMCSERGNFAEQIVKAARLGWYGVDAPSATSLPNLLVLLRITW